MATKLGAVAKCVFSELLYGCRGGRSEIKSLHLLEVSSLVLTNAIQITNLFSKIASSSLRFSTRAAFEEYLGSSAK